MNAAIAPPQAFPRLGDRYELESLIGSGGFSEVYRAYDRQRREHVAIKLLRGLDPSALLRFKREFRVMADAVDPHLVSLYELSSAGDRWFFTMELVDGVELTHYVSSSFDAAKPTAASSGELRPPSSGTVEEPSDVPVKWISLGAHDDGYRETQPPEPPKPNRQGHIWDRDRLYGALDQLADGLMSLHAMGVLHRDVKPSNVLVTRDGRVVLLDFGLLTEMGRDRSREETLVGSVHYIAPELVRGLAAAPAADWYAVGVMLFEALTGSPPFTGHSLKVLVDKMNGDAPRPSTLVSGVPAELDDLCARLLSRDPSERPSGSRIKAVLAGRTPLKSDAPRDESATALIGREEELVALAAAFRASSGGRPVLVRLSGRSGLGKSALAREFCRRAQQEGALVLYSRCYSQESVPYKALDPLVDSLVQSLSTLDERQLRVLLPKHMDALARLFPVMGMLIKGPGQAEADPESHERPALDPQEIRRHAFAAFRDLVYRLTRRQPIVVHLDDLQWGDLDSALLLRDLLRPPAPPILLLAAFRSEDVLESEFLRTFLPEEDFPGEIDVRTIEVAPLDDTQSRALASAHLARPLPPAALDRIVREGHGTPFLIEQLVHHVNVLGERDGSAGHRFLEEARSIEHVVHARLASLEGADRKLIEVVAVAGSPIDAQVAMLAAEAASVQHMKLRAHKLLRVVGGEPQRLDVYHETIRETIVARLEPGALAHYHLRLGQELEKKPDRVDPERLMRHFAAGGEHTKASRYAVSAAAQAFSALAFDRAVQLYQESLRLDPAHEGHDERRIQLAYALACAGRSTEAAREYLEAARRATGSAAFDMERMAAEQLLQHGHIDQGLVVLQRLVPKIGVHVPRTPRQALLSYLANTVRLRVRGYGFEERQSREIAPDDLARIDFCWAIGTGLTMNNTLRGADMLTRTVLYSLRAGEPYRIARAFALHVAYLATAGSRSAGRTAKMLALAEENAQRANHPHAYGVLWLVKGMIAYLEGRFPDGVRFCARAEEELRQWPGTSWEVTSAQAFGATSDVYCGNLRKLAGVVPERLRDAERRGNLYAQATIRMSPISIYWLVANQPEQAEIEIDTAISRWSKDGFQMEHYWELFARGQIDLYVGRPDKAVDRLSERWPAFAGSLLPRIQLVNIQATHLRARCFLAAAARSSGTARDNLLAMVDKDAKKMLGQGVRWGAGLAGLLRAGALRQRGDVRGAVEQLRDAIAELDAAGVKLYAMAARMKLARYVEPAEREALMGLAGSWLMSEGVVDAERFVDMAVPGV